MTFNKKQVISWLFIAIAIFLFNFSFPASSIAFAGAGCAIATIQQQQEAPGQLLYSSRHKLRNSQGNTWQVILFKRVKQNQTQDLDLRLVGFPQQFEFTHPGDLTIVVNDERVLIVGDRFAEKSPSPNVGEFEVDEIISDLPQVSICNFSFTCNDRSTCGNFAPCSSNFGMARTC